MDDAGQPQLGLLGEVSKMFVTRVAHGDGDEAVADEQQPAAEIVPDEGPGRAAANGKFAQESTDDADYDDAQIDSQLVREMDLPGSEEEDRAVPLGDADEDEEGSGAEGEDLIDDAAAEEDAAREEKEGALDGGGGEEEDDARLFEGSSDEEDDNGGWN
jgi:hypothetical protein